MKEEIQKYFLPVSILISAILIAGAWVYTAKLKVPNVAQESATSVKTEAFEEQTVDQNLVLPSEGVELPVIWGNLGAQMVKSGVIDSQKFEDLYSQRGGLSEEDGKILDGESGEKLKMTPQNSGFLLNMLWALGFGNKNEILEKGPIATSSTDVGRFASTGGWSLAKGDKMSHFSNHRFVNLTPEQQQLVEKVSKGIYRPCCGNSTYFPDCNHGMAMLGLIELMASQGISEQEMYKTALQVNSYWFPDTYLTIAQYLKDKKGISFDKTDPKEILGVNYSSGSGFSKILQEVEPVQPSGGGGRCGV